MNQEIVFWLDWWILKRDEERMIVSTIKDGDPLFGYGSWELAVLTPFASYEEALKNMPLEIQEFVVSNELPDE